VNYMNFREKKNEEKILFHILSSIFIINYYGSIISFIFK
jgi:hypothetical protein